MATKIVFSPPMPKDIMDEARAMVPTGYELAVVDRSVPNALDAHRDAEYFIGFARGDMGPDFYEALPKLKLVQLISAGYDRLDVAAAKQAGVPVANNGGANATAVAEHTWLLILGVLKRLAWQHNNVVAGKWRIGDLAENRLYEVSGKTLGIVGLGTIGKKVARRAHAFEMRVLYYDTVRLTEDQEDALNVRFVLLDELLREADVVSLHVPLNTSTRRPHGPAPVRSDEAVRHPRQHLPRAGGGRGSAPAGAGERADRGRRPRCHGRGAGQAGASPLRRAQHDHHPAHGGPDLGELAQGLPQRLRQCPARRPGRGSDVGYSGAPQGARAALAA